MKHTKGPWKIVHQTKAFEIFSEAEDISICELNHDEQSLLNAKLIAVAPQMYELIQRLTDWQSKPTAQASMDEYESILEDMCLLLEKVGS